jgi:magnesium chelatase subunit D
VSDAALAAALLAVDPHGLGGVWLRAAPGPARDAWLASLRARLAGAAPVRRLPSHAPDARLLGGLDLAATLRAGHPVAERGLLAECDGGVVIAAMAERMSPGMAARLAAALDNGAVDVERDGLGQRHAAQICVVALDEGLEDERPPPALTERLAFQLRLDAAVDAVPQQDVTATRSAYARVSLPDEAAEALCMSAAALGVESLRAPVFAMRAARAAAALGGRAVASQEDLEAAARLVLAPRATRLPAPPSESPEQPLPPEPDEAERPEEKASTGEPKQLEDVLLGAALAALPPDLLASLAHPAAAGRGQQAAGRAGEMRQAAGRGRPVGTRAGMPRNGARLALVETLRAAAPWQRLRPRAPGARISVRPDDLRVLRLRHRTGTTAIFLVDASGSSALHRLAEAKGAVELLLSDCYARRDNVAVIGFRGTVAELLLPPTPSLARAKRSLAGLPGGGGTPLAAAIEAGGALATQVRRGGRSPLLVLLTDARANVARDGSPGRARAEADALVAGRALREARVPCLLIDTSPRPSPQAQRLAAEMGARLLPLPQADAAAMSRAVRDAA